MLPGWLISSLTFPGVIAHEFGHKFFCQQFQVPVFKVCYFRFGNPAGYVIHGEPGSFAQSFFIVVGPFIVNNILAIAAFILMSPLVGMNEMARYVIGWLGFSFAMNAFPSNGDAKNLWAMTKRHAFRNFLSVIIGLPFVVVIYVANLLSVIWFNLIWAVLLYAFADSILLKIII